MLFFSGLGCFSFILWCSCNLIFIENVASDKAVSVGQLKVSNTEISNWKLSSSADSFTLWTAANFEQDIDGGYEIYTDRGMIECGDIHMLGPAGSDGVQNEIAAHSFIMDFGNDSNAVDIYNYQKTRYSADAFDIPRYPNTIAFARSILGGITVYAHFKKFYLELNFTGFSDQNHATTTAIQFLGLLKSKIE